MTDRIRWSHVFVVVSVVVIVQVAIFDQALLAGAIRLDLPLYLLVAIGFICRSDEAAVLGFLVGLTVDLFQFSPFGLNAFLYCLVAWSLAEIRVRMLAPGTSFRTIQGALATVAVTAISWFAGTIFEQDPPPFDNNTLAKLAIIGILGGVMVHPATGLARWMVVDREATAPVTS